MDPVAAARLQEDFYRAAYGNDLAALLLATSKGVDVNDTDEFGSTALHFACQHGNTEAVAMLLENGAKIDHKNKIGSTPLHRAAREGHESCVRLLLERGHPVNAQTSDGATPLHLAAEWGQAAVCRQLLAAGASTALRNRDDRSPLDLAYTPEAKAALAGRPATTPSGTGSGSGSGSGPAAKLSLPPPSLPAPSPPASVSAVATSPHSAAGGGVGAAQLPALFAGLGTLLDRGKSDKDIAAATRSSVDEVKKLVAAVKPARPGPATELERAAGEMVVAVKQVLTAKASAAPTDLEPHYANLTRVIEKLKTTATNATK